jgi:hypothetical protein
MSLPNYEARIAELAERHPDAWMRAHDGTPNQWDFVKIVAADLHALDARVGLNHKRGTGDLSADAIAILDPSGDTTDISGARSFVVDFIAGAGGQSPSVTWQSVGGVSGWERPDGVAPPPGPPPAPVPAPSTCQFQPCETADLRSALVALINEVAGVRRDMAAQGELLDVAVYESKQAAVRCNAILDKLNNGFTLDASARFVGKIEGTVK